MKATKEVIGNLKHIIEKALGRSAEERKLPTTKQRIARWVEGILLVSGLILLAFFGAVRLDGHLRTEEALELFESSDSTNVVVEAMPTADGIFEEPDFSQWGQQRVQAYQQQLRKKEAPIAVLRIPSIRLVAPLFDGTDRFTLNRGVGRIAGTAAPGGPGNIGIAGHRDSFFRGLKDIKPGDAIELRLPTGTDTYIVDGTQIVAPRNVSVLRPRPVPSLTLVTCYPFYLVGSAPQRFVVTAHLTQRRPAGLTTSEPRPIPQTHNPLLEEQ